MRISDWSSDLCSSDLADSSHDATLCHRLASHSPMATGSGPVARSMAHRNHPGALPLCSGRVFYLGSCSVPSHPTLGGTFTRGRPAPGRSEERHRGQECDSKFTLMWGP